MRRMYDENEIKSIASKSGRKLYEHSIRLNTSTNGTFNAVYISTSRTKLKATDLNNIQDYLLNKDLGLIADAPKHYHVAYIGSVDASNEMKIYYATTYPWQQDAHVNAYVESFLDTVAEL